MRMMPLAFPKINWSAINESDQQYMLGDDLLVAPVAFYGSTRAVYLPDGEWLDVLSGEYVEGPAWRIHDVPLEKMPIFVRKGASLVLALDPEARRAVEIVFGDGDAISRGQDGWVVEAVGIVKGGIQATKDEPEELAAFSRWFGTGIEWTNEVE
jgi:alpha-D-xyloside xylohydrolase